MVVLGSVEADRGRILDLVEVDRAVIPGSLEVGQAESLDLAVVIGCTLDIALAESLLNTASKECLDFLSVRLGVDIPYRPTSQLESSAPAVSEAVDRGCSAVGADNKTPEAR
jgi:hypothetical protein